VVYSKRTKSEIQIEEQKRIVKHTTAAVLQMPRSELILHTALYFGATGFVQQKKKNKLVEAFAAPNARFVVLQRPKSGNL